MSRPKPVISVDELRQLDFTGACRIVDCRFDLKNPEKGAVLYEESHIDGAVFADLDKDLADPVTADTGRHPLPDVQAFCRKLGAWGISNSTHVVAYDHGNGSTAGRLWWLMRWLGHTDVSVLDGGYVAWVDSGGATGEGRQDTKAVAFHGRPDSSMVATTEDILDLIVSGESCNLVDARDPPRFRGEVEPIDSVAGRIPGAINMPFPANLDGEGKWRQASDLRDRWKEVLRDRPDTVPIAMCGSGVTACHLIIAAERADLPLPRLYVGSWSEWIRDTERPVATG